MNTAILMLITVTQINSPENIRISDAIAYTESRGDYRASGDNGLAYGAYQMHKTAWDDANVYRKANGLVTYAWYNRKYKGAQDSMCRTFIELIKYRFNQIYLREPTPAEIYMAYTCGFHGAERLNFDVKKLSDLKQRAILIFMDAYRGSNR